MNIKSIQSSIIDLLVSFGFITEPLLGHAEIEWFNLLQFLLFNVNDHKKNIHLFKNKK